MSIIDLILSILLASSPPQRETTAAIANINAIRRPTPNRDCKYPCLIPIFDYVKNMKQNWTQNEGCIDLTMLLKTAAAPIFSCCMSDTNTLKKTPT